MANNKYAIYPGTITNYAGVVEVWSAADLAAAYGVQAQPYIVISNPTEELKGKEYCMYIHLKPRKDGMYYNALDRNIENGTNIDVYEDPKAEAREEAECSSRW